MDAPTQVWAWPATSGRPARGFAPKSDTWCRKNTIPPVLSLQAHSAPLGITFYDWKASCNCRGSFPKYMDGTSTPPPSRSFMHASEDRQAIVLFAVCLPVPSAYACASFVSPNTPPPKRHASTQDGLSSLITGLGTVTNPQGTKWLLLQWTPPATCPKVLV